MDGYREIEGFFGDQEARFYRQQVRRARVSARFVEIGSWKGRSAYCMADEIRDSGKAIEFWCVDTWRGSDEHQDLAEVREDRLFDEFMNNVSPVSDYLTPLRMASVEASEQFDDRSLDFVFIDAAHDYENVLVDIRAWQGKIRPGGVLAGHDYKHDWPGVVQAVEEAFGARTGVYGQCWYFAPGVSDAAPRSLRALRKKLQWRVRRLTRPEFFRRPT